MTINDYLSGLILFLLWFSFVGWAVAGYRPALKAKIGRLPLHANRSALWLCVVVLAASDSKQALVVSLLGVLLAQQILIEPRPDSR